MILIVWLDRVLQSFEISEAEIGERKRVKAANSYASYLQPLLLHYHKTEFASPH